MAEAVACVDQHGTHPVAEAPYTPSVCLSCSGKSKLTQDPRRVPRIAGRVAQLLDGRFVIGQCGSGRCPRAQTKDAHKSDALGHSTKGGHQ